MLGDQVFAFDSTPAAPASEAAGSDKIEPIFSKTEPGRPTLPGDFPQCQRRWGFRKGWHYCIRKNYNAFVMRTTIELKEEHRALLHAIAARRGWRGYSKVIEEAIEFYLQHHSEAKDVRRALLDRRGAWGTEEAEKVREAIRELREKWIVPSGSS